MSKRLKMLEAEQEQEMRALLGPDAKIETYGESVKGIGIKTYYNKDVIHQVHEAAECSALERAVTQTMQLKEDGVRQALIKLGWTPPPSNNDQLSTAEQWKNEIHNNVAVIVDPDGDEIVMVEELVEFLADKFGGDV